MTVIVTSSRGPKGDTGATGSTGAAGAAGSNGADGSTVVDSYDGSSNAGTTSATPSSLADTAFALNTISQGDVIVVDATFDCDVITGIKKGYFYINGSIAQSVLASFDMEEGIKRMTVNVAFRRINTTTILAEYTGTMYNEHYQEDGKVSFREKRTISDMTSLTNTIAIYGSASGAGDRLYLRNYVVTQNKA